MAPNHPMHPVLITMHMKGHARHSGYDRLTDYIHGTLLARPDRPSLTDRIATRLLKPLVSGSGSEWYHRESLMTELRAAFRWLRKPRCVFHFLYGENLYRHLGKMKRISSEHAIVCTYHTPPERFRQVVKDHDHVKQLDAIIVMSTMQIPFFSELVGEKKVHYIPHGVDTDHFRPAPDIGVEKKPLECLLVVHHLRDFDTFAKAVEIVGRKTRDLEFVIVAPTRFHHHFAGMNNVRLLSGISDAELLERYQQADLFALPLQDSTANNVLLEAMACGQPIIATDLQGVRDYVNDECALLVPPEDEVAFAETLLRLSEEREMRRRMGQASREMALRFRWERIAEQTLQLYEGLPPRE